MVKTFIGAVIAVISGASSSAQAENFVPVETMRGHPGLGIDVDSIKREGSLVSLTYRLETSTGANDIDGTIDCAARTFNSYGLRVHPETLPPGAVRRLPPESPQPIKDKSTWDFLARVVCK